MWPVAIVGGVFAWLFSGCSGEKEKHVDDKSGKKDTYVPPKPRWPHEFEPKWQAGGKW